MARPLQSHLQSQTPSPNYQLGFLTALFLHKTVNPSEVSHLSWINIDVISLLINTQTGEVETRDLRQNLTKMINDKLTSNSGIISYKISGLAIVSNLYCNDENGKIWVGRKRFDLFDDNEDDTGVEGCRRTDPRLMAKLRTICSSEGKGYLEVQFELDEGRSLLNG